MLRPGQWRNLAARSGAAALATVVVWWVAFSFPNLAFLGALAFLWQLFNPERTGGGLPPEIVVASSALLLISTAALAAGLPALAELVALGCGNVVLAVLVLHLMLEATELVAAGWGRAVAGLGRLRGR